VVADATVYAAGSYHVYRSGRKRPVLLGQADGFDEAQLCTTVCAQKYFGHFFHDSLVLEELAARRRLMPLTFVRTPWLHEPKYRALFDRQAIATSWAQVDRLWLVDERNLNQGWVSRFEALRARLRGKVTSGGSRNVFITRGSLFTGRSLANEPKLAELLKRSGFEVLEPEKEDPETIAATLKDAQLVVCVAGSAEVHALLAMPAEATLIEIQLAPFFGTIGKILAESINVRWGYVVAERTAEGFTLEPDRLLRTLELVGKT
jgi:capsular polysaccharide biosynthesis protein